MSRASGNLFLSSRTCHCVFTRVVPSGTIQLLTNKTEAVMKAAASFDGGKVQSVDIHGIWVSSWVGSCSMRGVFIS